MSWKHLCQYSLADALLPAQKALTELDDVHDLIDWSPIEALLSGIHNSKCGEQA